MPEHATEPKNRRDFVRALALGASAGTLAFPTSARADDKETEKSKAKGDDKPDPLKAEADARMALIVARFGKHLDDDARKAVRDELDGIIRRAERLRKVPLDNGDGPFPVFHPYRAPLA
ncbi:MAG TPA: hypothetical protein VG406_23720 [Isosphaeraceae bacterium]|jgi:hypothetical protein|nr:hypothetical protein [Isosphaeraceae bacterium]